MATIRISTKQIKSITVEDKKTWPVDLQVWVELSTYRNQETWDAPFYLLPDQIKALKKMVADAVKRRAEEKQKRGRWR